MFGILSLKVSFSSYFFFGHERMVTISQCGEDTKTMTVRVHFDAEVLCGKSKRKSIGIGDPT